MTIFNVAHNAQRHRLFIINTSLALAILHLLLTVATFIQLVGSSSNPGLSFRFPIFILATILYGLSWWLAKRSKPEWAAHLIFVALLGATTTVFMSGLAIIISAIMFLIIAMFALILLGTQAAWGVLIWCSLLSIFNTANGRMVFTASGSEKVTFDQLIYLLVIMFVVIWLASYLSSSLTKANAQLTAQTERLETILNSLEQKRDIGESVSRQIFSLTAELNAIANQQAGGSQQQASALTQVTSFIQELTSTAQTISNKAGQLHQAATRIAEIASQIKANATEMTETGDSGARAVDQAIASTQEMVGQYDELREVLAKLEQRQGKIREVISTIKEISDQTHLLALNAAIEAAGAGEHGERFQVVAGEVKNLADRSVRASREVSEILSKVEEGIEQVARAVETGRQHSQVTLTVTHQGGEVLRELVVSVFQGAEEIDLIAQASNIVSEQTREISLATQQQFNASQQALESLQSVGSVAAQTASGSTEVTRSTQSLEKLSHHLLATLAG